MRLLQAYQAYPALGKPPVIFGRRKGRNILKLHHLKTMSPPHLGQTLLAAPAEPLPTL